MMRTFWDQRAPALYGVIFFCALAAFLLLAQAHIRKNPLRGDEVDYYRSMESVVTLGLPLYYAGEVNMRPDLLIQLSTRRLDGQQFAFYRFRPETGILKETFFALKDGTSRYTYGMWHPPLYIYLGSLWFRLAPLTPATSAALRYFNLIFVIGIFAGLIVLSRTLYGARAGATAALAALLYATDSLAVRGAILIDYNAALAPCVAVWLTIAYLRSERDRRGGRALGLLTVLAFLTGLGIGAALLAGVGVYALLAGAIRRSWYAPASVGGGFLAFFPIFFALARLLGLPFSQPFLHNLQRVGARLDGGWLLAQARSALEYSIFYGREVGYPLILTGLCFAILLYAGRRSVAPANRRLLPTLVIVGFVLQGSLRAEAYGFPKYILFLLPLLCVFLAGETVIRLGARPTRWGRSLAGGILAGVILLQAHHAATWLLRPGGALYFAGEQGIEAIGRQARAITAPDEVLLSSKDIAFFADRKFVQWYGRLLSDEDLLRGWVESRQIRALASNVGLLDAAAPKVAAYLAQTFPMSLQEGDFQLRYAPQPSAEHQR